MKANKQTVAVIAALTAQMIFGLSFLFTKIALQHASVMVVIANRYTVAFCALTVFIWFKKIRIRFTYRYFKLFVMALFQPILYFIFESYGIKLTTSAFSSVMISLIPMVSMVGGGLILKEFPSPVQYFFSLLSVIGVSVLAYSGNINGTVTIVGVICLFIAVVSSTGYNICSRKLSQDFSVLERTYFMTVVGMLAFNFFALLENINNPVMIVEQFCSPSYLLCMGYLGIASSVVAFLCLNYANTYLPVAKTTSFSNLTTVVSVLAGAVFLKEALSFLSVCCIFVIVVGVWGVQIKSVKQLSE